MADTGKLLDLQAIDLSELKWDSPENSSGSIDLLYRIVQDKARGAIQWYWTKRNGRKRWAQILRGLAVAFAALGLMIPAAALVWPDRVPSPLGYLMFVLVGACLLVNTVIGVSSGWIRYVISAMALQRQLDEFQLDWAGTMARIGGAPRGDDDIEQLLGKLRGFTGRVNEIVEQETRTWGAEFERDLARLEQLASARSQSRDSVT